MARAIDAEYVEKIFEKWLDNIPDGEETPAIEACLNVVRNAPSLTPPNEWVSVENAVPDPQARPRICEVLGVEVGERFRIDYPKGMTVWLYINKEGFVVREGGPKNLKIGNSVAWAINHPDRIIRKPCWTQQEVDLAKLLYDFRRSKSVIIGRNKSDILWWRDGDSAEGILPYKLFPSLNCGDSVKLSDIIGSRQ